MRLTEMHEVARNPAFKGLSENDVTDLACYSHFRNVQSKKKQQDLLKDDAVFQRDFLDDLSADKPIGVWSCQKYSDGCSAIIRNHKWFGFTAFAAPKSRTFGSCYIGEGL
jgi:hypothetical protein